MLKSSKINGFLFLSDLLSVYFFTVSTLTENKRLVCSCGKNNREDQDSCIPTVDGKSAVPVLRTVFPVREIVGARDAATKKARNFAK